jgi:hypothetical protein
MIFTSKHTFNIMPSGSCPDAMIFRLCNEIEMELKSGGILKLNQLENHITFKGGLLNSSRWALVLGWITKGQIFIRKCDDGKVALSYIITFTQIFIVSFLMIILLVITNSTDTRHLGYLILWVVCIFTLLPILIVPLLFKRMIAKCIIYAGGKIISQTESLSDPSKLD